jgi:hypothetical protein
MSQNFSPSSRPAVVPAIKQHTLAEALPWLLDPSKAIRRMSWTDSDSQDIAYLNEGYLMILRGSKESVFAIHETDIRGTDWIVIEKPKLNYASAATPVVPVQSPAIEDAEPQ